MVTKQKILVTGANGQLGMELKDAAKAFPQYQFLFVTREEFPLDDFEKMKTYFSEHLPQYVINCAAYTAVDKAETEKESAFKINGEAVKVLAELCNEHFSSLIHISTDYVFNGMAHEPYQTDHPTDPVNTYGASKLEGEKNAMLTDAIVIRTSWVYSYYGKNFVKTMMKLMSERPSLNVVGDQKGCPTYAADLAKAILHIIASGTWQGGFYHYSNTGDITWYDFAIAIKELTGSNCEVNAITTAQYPTPAKRPAYSVMDTKKIQQVFNVTLMPWKESLAECILKLQA